MKTPLIIAIAALAISAIASAISFILSSEPDVLSNSDITALQAIAAKK